MKPGKRRIPWLSLIAIAFFSATALFFGFKIANYLIDAHKSLDYWEELQAAVVIMAPDPQTDEPEQTHTPISEGRAEEPGTPVTETEMLGGIDFDRLHEISQDAVAWLYAPGTEINYVVAQGSDNDYYLHHLLDGSTASGGTIFVDYRCSADFSDWNTVVYGHHMKNVTMFGPLMNYQDPAFYEAHPVMYLYVPGKCYKLELIAGYTTDVGDMIFSIPATKEERDEIIARASKKSTFTSGVAVGAEDKLVTLSTCSYAYDNARYVVIGRITEA